MKCFRLLAVVATLLLCGQALGAGVHARPSRPAHAAHPRNARSRHRVHRRTRRGHPHRQAHKRRRHPIKHRRATLRRPLPAITLPVPVPTPPPPPTTLTISTATATSATSTTTIPSTSNTSSSASTTASTDSTSTSATSTTTSPTTTSTTTGTSSTTTTISTTSTTTTTTSTTTTPPPSCTAEVASVAEAEAQVASAAPGALVCLAAGSYGAMNLTGAHAGPVTLEPLPGASASIAGLGVAAGASNITIHNFTITGGVSLGAGDSHITIDHNDINGEGPGGDGEGVETGGVNCAAPNAPVYPGCTSTPPSTYITISGNRIHGYGLGATEDAIHLNNWQHVRVIANDIYDLEEHGNHTDALQSVWGGSDLLFERNYEHDNQAQGFFIRDGDVAQVKVADNLFLRNNNEPPMDEYNVQAIDTTEFTMTGNTVWDNQADLIRAEEAAEPLTATVERNVEEVFNVLYEKGPAYQLTEDHDLFREPPWTFTMGAHSIVVPDPEFVDPAADDYRLKSNPEHLGVDWAPAEYVYGPTGD